MIGVGIFRKLKIRTKIYAIVGVMTLVMLAIAGSSYLKFNHVTWFMTELYHESFIGLRYSSNINISLEKQLGLVAGAPAILDGRKLAQSKADFDGLSTVIKGTIDEYKKKSPSAESLEQIQTIEKLYDQVLKDSEEVYKLTASFAQEQASTVLETKVKKSAQDIEDDLSVMVIKFDVAADNGIKSILASIKLFTLWMIAVLAVVIVIVSGSGFVVARQISFRINNLSSLMRQMADGDLTIDAPYTASQDELGVMACALQYFKEAGLLLREQNEEKRKEFIVKEERQKKVSMLIKGFDQDVTEVISSLASAATELNHTSENMKDVIRNANNGVITLSESAGEVTQKISAIASATDGLTASAQEIAEQVTKSGLAVDEAFASSSRTEKAAQSLMEASDAIGGIVMLINNITGQINLLALNATIESARAGEAGKGFAVVASEVKQLATQTGQATQDISAKIEHMQAISKVVLEGLNNTIASMVKVKASSAGIAAAVDQQTYIAGDIASSMQVAASSIHNVSENVGHIRNATSHADVSTQEVLSASAMLSEQSEMLNHSIRDFLSDIQNTDK